MSAQSNPIVEFEQPKVIEPCCMHTCTAGHKWSPKLAVVGCPGCNSHMLALMMVNCPICNEPCASTKLRIDYIAHSGAITPLCQGSETLAEPTFITIEHGHAQKEQARTQDRSVLSKI